MLESLDAVTSLPGPGAGAPADLTGAVQDILSNSQAPVASGDGALMMQSGQASAAQSASIAQVAPASSLYRSDLNAFLGAIDGIGDNIRGWAWQITRSFGQFSVSISVGRPRQEDYLTRDANGDYQVNWGAVGAALVPSDPTIVLKIKLKNPPPGAPGVFEISWNTRTSQVNTAFGQETGPNWPPTPSGPDTRPFKISGTVSAGTGSGSDIWDGGVGGTVSLDFQVPFLGQGLERLGQWAGAMIARAGTALSATTGAGPFGIALSTLAGLSVSELARGWTVWFGPRFGGALTVDPANPLESSLNIGGNKFNLGDAFGEQITAFFAADNSQLASWFRDVLNLPPLTVEVDQLVLGPIRSGSAESDRFADATIQLGVKAMLDNGADALSMLVQSFRLFTTADANENLKKNAAAIWKTDDPRMEIGRAALVALYGVEDASGQPLNFASMSSVERETAFFAGSGVRLAIDDPGLTFASLAGKLDGMSTRPLGLGAGDAPDEGGARIEALARRLAYLGYTPDFGSRYLQSAYNLVPPGVLAEDSVDVLSYLSRNDLRPVTSTRAPFPGADPSLSSQNDLKSGLLSTAFLFGSESGIEVNNQTLSGGFKSKVVDDVKTAIIKANAKDPVGGTAAVAKALEETRSYYAAGATEDNTMETAVLEAVRSDAPLLDAFAPLQLDLVKAGGATLTPYQEGAFLSAFKTNVATQDINASREAALATALAATPLTFGNFDISDGRFFMTPGKTFTFESLVPEYAPQIDDPLSGRQSFTRSEEIWENFLTSVGGYRSIDAKADTLEITNFVLQDGNLQAAYFETVLDDGAWVYGSIDLEQNTVRLTYYKSLDDPTYDVNDPKTQFRWETVPLDPGIRAAAKAAVESVFGDQPKPGPLSNAPDSTNGTLMSSTGNRQDAIDAANDLGIVYFAPGSLAPSQVNGIMYYSAVVEDKNGKFWVEQRNAVMPPGMNRAELAAWVQTQKDNVTALYKPDTVKSVELFYDKAYVPTDGASNLPEPQLPPGVEPDNSKDLGGAIYPAANPQDAGRIAYNLLQDQPFGNFVLVLRDRNTGQYWVSGPYPGDTTNAEAMARFPANFQRMSTPERPRLTLPEPMRSPTGRPAGSLNARFYPADNGRDAINMARLSYFNYAGNEEPYYMILQSSITDEYYMDGPFLPSDITASELAATYPSYLRVISTLFPN